MNLPNKITLSRVIIIVAMVMVLSVFQIIGSFVGGFIPLIDGAPINFVNLGVCILFIIAASTDWLDGYIARKRGLVTDLGKFMDPLADKLLVNSILVFLCIAPTFVDYGANAALAADPFVIPFFLVVVMLIRDFAVDGLRLVAVKKNKVIAANIFGKLKTVAQMVTIPVLLLGGWPFSYFDGSWNIYARISIILLIITTVLSIASGIIYFVQNGHVLKEPKEADVQH